MGSVREYVAEFNRCRGDNIKRTARRLTRAGLPSDLSNHKTTIFIEKPADVPWKQMLQNLKTEIDPKLGSVLLFSRKTGNVFRCSNKGNRPGYFEKI